MDELKFHKHWNSHYRIKGEKIFDVIEKNYDKMQMLGNFFQDFNLKKNVGFIKKKEIKRAEILLE